MATRGFSVLAALVSITVGACYQPSYPEGLACSSEKTCPPDQTCGLDGRCRSSSSSDAGIDQNHDAAICSGSGACVPPGAVARWTCDDHFGDAIGSQHAQWTASTTFQEGVAGNAGFFDSANDTAYVPEVTGLPTGTAERTLELWINMIAPVANEAFFAGYGQTVNRGGFFFGATGDRLFISQWGDSIQGPALEAERWYHVAATYKSGYVTLYVDGVAYAQRYMDIATPTSGNRMGFGYLDATRRLYGLVDEVRVYNRALSAAEVAEIYGSSPGTGSSM